MRLLRDHGTASHDAGSFCAVRNAVRAHSVTLLGIQEEVDMVCRVALLSVISLLISSSVARAQGQTASDAQALALAAQSIAALTGQASISDVTLTGTASWL